jgi:hypothetical protein
MLEMANGNRKEQMRTTRLELLHVHALWIVNMLWRDSTINHKAMERGILQRRSFKAITQLDWRTLALPFSTPLRYISV